MTKNQSQLIVRAAIAGLISAATVGISSAAMAADDGSIKGQCVGANACKGQSGCKQEGLNACKGHNGCAGKGFLEKTKAECEAIIKKDKKVHFQASK